MKRVIVDHKLLFSLKSFPTAITKEGWWHVLKHMLR